VNTNEVGTIAEIPSLAEGASRTRFLSSLCFSMTNRRSDGEMRTMHLKRYCAL